MATVYIANSNVSFEKAFLFNGYLPSTHSGLNDTINEAAPLDVDALIFGGGNDVFISGVDELAGVYQEPTVIISSTADHHLLTAGMRCIEIFSHSSGRERMRSLDVEAWPKIHAS